MPYFKAICKEGELGNGRIKRPGNGTLYDSLSAAQRAIDRYKGPEKLTAVPASPTPK